MIAPGCSVRPWYGHAEHFHVQVACPEDSPDCKLRRPPRPSDGCDQELDFWFKESTLNHTAVETEPPLTLALPPLHANRSSKRRDCPCPLWVKSKHLRCKTPCLLCPESGHAQRKPSCLLWAKSGHCAAYSISSSARPISVFEQVRPSALRF